MYKKQILTLLFCATWLAACSTTPPTSPTPPASSAPNPAVDWTDNRLRDDIRSALRHGEIDRAIDNLEVLAARYPGARHAQEMLLENAVEIHQQGRGTNAVERFIQKNPSHPHLDYAYYLRGLIGFYDGLKKLETPPTGNALDVPPEQSAPARSAFQYFSELLRRFPASPFRADAIQRMLQLRNGLAELELTAARRYLAAGHHEAALARSKYVLENYPHSPAAVAAVEVITAAAQPSSVPGSSPVPVTTLPPATANSAPATTTPPSPPSAVSPPDSPVEKSPSPAASVTVRDEAWINSHPATHYTVQLLSSGNRAALVAFAEKYQLTDTAIFANHQTMPVSYGLLRGTYSTRAAAEMAAQTAARQLGLSKPWVRRFDAVQEIIRKGRARP